MLERSDDCNTRKQKEWTQEMLGIKYELDRAADQARNENYTDSVYKSRQRREVVYI